MIMINTYMRKFLTNLRKNAGFTLIELLVVIGILGILAAALIATVDPFEQLKKGRDTTTRNTALEYLNAMTRYYATHAKLPWDNGVTGCVAPATAVLLSAATMTPCTAALETEGELKTGFGTAVANSGADDLIRVRTTAAGASNISLCFSPTAKSFKADDASKYDATCTGVAPVTCDTATERLAAADGTCWQEFK